ncbi:MAG: DUF502 domain-containing protein [Chloroflexi bacterium]|nr:DUF502 domain-containing protein [Chloroflexota bacterium]
MNESDKEHNGTHRTRVRWYRFGAIVGRRVISNTRSTFLVGALLVFPIALTYLVLRFTFDTIDGIVRPAIEHLFDISLPGLGILVEIAIIYLAGLLFSNFVGRRLIGWTQRMLLRVPVIGFVYNASKQLIESFSGTGGTGFKRVVMIEYPRKGTWTIGFLTSITSGNDGDKLAVVYIPTAPTPNSGWVALLPLDDVHDTDLTVQQALRLVLSGGILSPSTIKTRKIEASETQ